MITVRKFEVIKGKIYLIGTWGSLNYTNIIITNLLYNHRARHEILTALKIHHLQGEVQWRQLGRLKR